MKLTILSLTVAIEVVKKGGNARTKKKITCFLSLFKINDKGASAMEEMVVVTPEN